MKVIAILVGLLAVACASQPSVAENAEKNIVPMDLVVRQVQQALADAQTTLDDESLPPLKSVVLSLQTVLDTSQGGSIKLFIFSFGASHDQTKTQQVDITLVPPKAGNASLVSERSLTQALEQAIVNAAKGVKDAGANPKVPLQLSALKVKIGFTVKNGGNGEAVPQILPITLDLKGNVSQTDVQTIEITYEAQEKKS